MLIENENMVEDQCEDELGPVMWDIGSVYSWPSSYWKYGFMISRQLIPLNKIEEANVMDMKRRFLGCEMLRYVFNKDHAGERSKGFNQRLQIITKTFHEERTWNFTTQQKNLLKTCRNLVIGKSNTLLGVNHEIKVAETMLYSVDGANLRQKKHRDLEYEHKESAVLAFVSLEAHTSIVIYGQTHEPEKLKGRMPVGRRYGLGVGDVMFFHPYCVHSGDKYKDNNLRLHYYSFLKDVDWELDTTYRIDYDEDAKLENGLKNVPVTVKRVNGIHESQLKKKCRYDRQCLQLKINCGIESKRELQEMKKTQIAPK